MHDKHTIMSAAVKALDVYARAIQRGPDETSNPESASFAFLVALEAVVYEDADVGKWYYDSKMLVQLNLTMFRAGPSVFDAYDGEMGRRTSMPLRPRPTPIGSPSPQSREYLVAHRACPRCGETDVRTTTMTVLYPDRNQNHVHCRCGFAGTVHDLVPEKKGEVES